MKWLHRRTNEAPTEEPEDHWIIDVCPGWAERERRELDGATLRIGAPCWDWWILDPRGNWVADGVCATRDEAIEEGTRRYEELRVAA